MNYLFAFFLPPIYLLSRGKIVAGIINGCFYVLGIFTIFFGVGAFFLLCCIIHAMTEVKREEARYSAELHGAETSKAVKDALAAQQGTAAEKNIYG